MLYRRYPSSQSAESEVRRDSSPTDHGGCSRARRGRRANAAQELSRSRPRRSAAAGRRARRSPGGVFFQPGAQALPVEERKENLPRAQAHVLRGLGVAHASTRGRTVKRRPVAPHAPSRRRSDPRPAGSSKGKSGGFTPPELPSALTRARIAPAGKSGGRSATDRRAVPPVSGSPRRHPRSRDRRRCSAAERGRERSPHLTQRRPAQALIRRSPLAQRGRKPAGEQPSPAVQPAHDGTERNLEAIRRVAVRQLPRRRPGVPPRGSTRARSTAPTEPVGSWSALAAPSRAASTRTDQLERREGSPLARAAPAARREHAVQDLMQPGTQVRARGEGLGERPELAARQPARDLRSRQDFEWRR